MKGLEGSSWVTSREPLVYCSAWEFVLSFAGATWVVMLAIIVVDGGVWRGNHRSVWSSRAVDGAPF